MMITALIFIDKYTQVGAIKLCIYSYICGVYTNGDAYLYI